MKQKNYICACKKCGEMFRCFHWNNRGKNSLDLEEIVVTAINELLRDKSKFQEQLQPNTVTVISDFSAPLIDMYR